MHFLIRGNVTRAASGYNVEMLVVDAATERVLGTKSLTLAAGALTPRRREELDSALGGLTFNALTAEVERARNKPVDSLDVRDLSFRAYVDWGRKKQEKDEKGAYVTATELLNRALALAPDDPLALSHHRQGQSLRLRERMVEERRGAAGHRCGGAVCNAIERHRGVEPLKLQDRRGSDRSRPFAARTRARRTCPARHRTDLRSRPSEVDPASVDRR